MRFFLVFPTYFAFCLKIKFLLYGDCRVLSSDFVEMLIFLCKPFAHIRLSQIFQLLLIICETYTYGPLCLLEDARKWKEEKINKNIKKVLNADSRPEKSKKNSLTLLLCLVELSLLFAWK